MSDGSIKIDIIILSFAVNDLLKDVTLNAVNTLIGSESTCYIQFDIVVIESNRNLSPYQYPGTKTIYPKQKFGYHRYMNLGIRKTKNKYICLCNNDLIFHTGWATAMIDSFSQDEDLVSASPFCSNTHPSKGFIKNSGVFYGYRIKNEVAGWCIFFKREILRNIGLFDTSYRFWYADNDYSRTLQKHDLKHALITSSIVDHMENQTLQTKTIKEQLKLTVTERFYYEYKWEGRTYGSYRYNRRKYHAIINNQKEDL